jgi:hypothetical protein
MLLHMVDDTYSRFVLATLILGAAPAAARAHSLGVEARQVIERVEVEAFFSDNTPARAARVQIVDDAGESLGTGTTDDEGKCSLRAPNPGQYQLIVDAGDGHRKQVPLRIVGTLPPPQANPALVAGTPREEFTRFPWERIATGVGVIALFAGIFWWSRHASKNPHE